MKVYRHIVMDGVYADQPDGTMLFHPLPAPSDEDIARLARAVCRKVTRYLGQLTGEDKDQQLTLDHLANASVQGLVATGPRRGCRVLRLGGTGEDAEAAIVGKRCALTCPKCQGRMKILAAITEPDAIRKILDDLGIPSVAPRRTAARPPPQTEPSGTADLAEADYVDPPSPEW
jgi:hypothetical protein